METEPVEAAETRYKRTLRVCFPIVMLLGTASLAYLWTTPGETRNEFLSLGLLVGTVLPGLLIVSSFLRFAKFRDATLRKAQ